MRDFEHKGAKEILQGEQGKKMEAKE